MALFELDCSEVADLLKKNLKIENSVKSIAHTFLNPRFSNRVDYSPYFQRNYVWDIDKATYFIESILLGTEIPPIVLFDNGEKNEVIDGRQRYETIKRFLDNNIVLSSAGLKSLSSIAERTFAELTSEIQESFKITKIRILQFSIVNEPRLTPKQEDTIKKEIFRRYNSGITALKRQDIERAEFINDSIASKFKSEFESNSQLLNQSSKLLLPKRKQSMKKREKINYLLVRTRSLITIPYIPIFSYAAGSSKPSIIRTYYYEAFNNCNPCSVFSEFTSIINVLALIQKEASNISSELSNNPLFFETIYWAFAVILKQCPQGFESISFEKCARDFSAIENFDGIWEGIDEASRSVLNIFDATGSHYYKAIVYRYLLVSNYFSMVLGFDLSAALKNSISFKIVMSSNIASKQFSRFKLSKTDPVSSTIFDILADIKSLKFLIRPDYQRSEVANIQKASYLLESILLGIRIPPLFIYRRKDGISEVVDGQQRLLSIIGFLGEEYLDETGHFCRSDKHRFKLTKLRILSEVEGFNIEKLDEFDPKYKDRILDFPIDIVEISEEQNPDFHAIDLFLRLNSRPYPIEPNTFEMWNAFISKEIVERIKRIAKKYSGSLLKPSDTRMKNEELLTTLGFLSYKTKYESLSPINAVDIFIRNRRINARIRNKSQITTILSDVSARNSDEFSFCLDEVELFIEKLIVLTGQGFPNLNNLLSHKMKNTQSRTNQNFYLLWIILSDFSLEDVSHSTRELFSEIETMFRKNQNINDRVIIDDYISSLISIKERIHV